MTQANPTVTTALVLQGLQTNPAQVFRDAAAALRPTPAAPPVPPEGAEALLGALEAQAAGPTEAQRQTLAALRQVPADVLACIQKGAGGIAVIARANVLEEVIDALPPAEAALLVEGHLTPAVIGLLLDARGENGSVLGHTISPELFAEASRAVMQKAAAGVEEAAPDEDDGDDDDDQLDLDDEDGEEEAGSGAGGFRVEEKDDRCRPSRTEIAAYLAFLPIFVSQRGRSDLQKLLDAALDGCTLRDYVVAGMFCLSPAPDRKDWMEAGFEDPDEVARIVDGFEANGWPPVPAQLDEPPAALPGAAGAPAPEAGDLKADF